MSDPVAAVSMDTPREKRVVFFCPACDEIHQVRVRGDGECWGWNQQLERPSFTPSVLTTRPAIPESKNVKHRTRMHCHAFVTNGRIAYCGDSEHALAGQTVSLPPLPEPWRSMKPYRGSSEGA